MKKTYLIRYHDIDLTVITTWINAFSSDTAIEKLKSEENDVFRIIDCTELPYFIKDADL